MLTDRQGLVLLAVWFILFNACVWRKELYSVIYRWFKGNRQLMRAREAAQQAFVNRDKKLARVMSEIAEHVEDAVEAGNEMVQYTLKPADLVVKDILIERLRNEGYMASHAAIDDVESRETARIEGLPMQLAFFPPRKGQPR